MTKSPGTSAVVSFARFPKMMVKTTVVSSGWMIAHSGPRIVCL